MKLLLKPRKRSAVSPVIATLLLIAIAVAAAIIVYAFVTGLIGGLSSGASSNLITATGTLTVPTGTTNGVLSITVVNNGNSPITGIQVVYTNMRDQGFLITCMGELPTVAGGVNGCGPAPTIPDTTACGAVNAVSATQSVVFCNATPAVINTNAQLQVGGQVSAAENVIGTAGTTLTSGASYSMTVTVDFANGGIHSQSLSVTAQI